MFILFIDKFIAFFANTKVNGGYADSYEKQQFYAILELWRVLWIP